MKIVLTVVAARDAAASLAVGSGAGILLQARVGNAASAAGDRAVGVLAADEGGVGGQGAGDGGKAQDDGGERELHFGGMAWSNKNPKNMEN